MTDLASKTTKCCMSPSLRALAVRVVTAAYRKEGDSLHP